MQPSPARAAALTYELALLAQRVLAWIPDIQARRATSGQLEDYCRRLRHGLALVLPHHKSAWGVFARNAGKDGFPLWNGDRVESAHQAVVTIAFWLYRLLGGRGVARGENTWLAPSRLLRLQLHLRRFVDTLFPGLDLTKPAMPVNTFHALKWELRDSENTSLSGMAPASAGAPVPDQLVYNSEWERLALGPRGAFRKFFRLGVSVASAKEIFGNLAKPPTSTEQGYLANLVALGYLKKPEGQAKHGRGYCLGRVPQGFPDASTA
jgi:hypothetical protein